MSGSSVPEITIIIATRNRAAILESCLDRFEDQEEPPRFELIIANNGSIDNTLDVIERFRARLPLVVLDDPVAGKSRALNSAVLVARGSLVAFTDDDVHVGRRWLSELQRGAKLYPATDVFCGPIRPLFPASLPFWLRQHKFSADAFAAFQPDVPEGALPMPFVPFGPNFAIRSGILKTWRFLETLGPSRDGNLMYEDVHLLRQLRRAGKDFTYIPDAFVVHVLRPELASIPVLYERAFNLGRSVIRAAEGIRLPQYDATGDSLESAVFGQAVLLNFYVGQLSELGEDQMDDRDCLLAEIRGLDLMCWERFLSQSAVEFLSAQRWK